MKINLKCNNGSAKLLMPQSSHDSQSPYVTAKIMVDISKSDLQQKIAIRCVAQPKVLGSDSKDALVMSHGDFIDILITNTTTKAKSLTIKVKISSSIIK